MRSSRLTDGTSRRAKYAAGVVLTALVTSCSAASDPVAVRPASEGAVDPVDEAPAAVVSATLTAQSRWGNGRALWADGPGPLGFVVVTTGGVWLVPEGSESADGDGLTQLDEFDSLASFGAAATAPDGETLAVASGSPTTIRRYDLAAGSMVDEITLPPGSDVLDLVVTDDGTVVAATPVGPLEWPVGASAAQPLLDAPNNDVGPGRVVLFPDGATITPSRSNEVIEVIDGSVERYPVGPDDSTVVDIAVSPEADLIAVSVGIGADAFERLDTITVFERSTWRQVASIESGRRLNSEQWAFSADGIAVTGTDGLTVWPFDGEPSTVAAADAAPVVAVVATPSGFVTAAADGALSVIEPGDGTVRQLAPGGLSLQHLDTHPAADSVVSVDFDGRVTVRRLADAVVVAEIDQFVAPALAAVTFTPDASTIAVTSSAGDVSLLDAATLAPNQSFRASDERASIGSATFTPDGGALILGLDERVADGAFDDTISIWNPADGSERAQLQGDRDEVGGCAFFFARTAITSDGSLMATAGHDFGVILSDPSTGEVLDQIPGTSTVLDLTISSDDRSLAISRDDASVEIWSLADRTLAASYEAALGGYLTMQFLPGVEQLVTIDLTGAMSVVEARSGRVVGTFADRSIRTSVMAVSPTGLIAAPAAPGVIGLWTSNGEFLATAAGHTANITGLSFNATGTQLASTSADGTLRLWSVDPA